MASSPSRLRIDVNRQLGMHRCESRKVCHATKADAFDMAESMMQRGEVDRGCHITPYQCKDCGYWHVYNRRIVYDSKFTKA